MVVCALILGMAVLGYAAAIGTGLISAPVSTWLAMPMVPGDHNPAVIALATILYAMTPLMLPLIGMIRNGRLDDEATPSNSLLALSLLSACLFAKIEPTILAIVMALAIANRVPSQFWRWLIEPSRHALERVVALGCDAMILFDASRSIVAANEPARSLLGDRLVGQPLHRYFPDLKSPEMADLDALSGTVVEMQARRESTEAKPVEVAFGRVNQGRERLGLIRVSDISARSERHRELERLALHDSLTGLPNRVLLHDRIHQAIAKAEREGGMLAVMLLDLDRFKAVNDTLGHHIGDALLQAVGPRLAEPLRRTDTLARLGGDEFAILLPAPVGLETALEVAQRIDEAVRTPFQVEGMNLEIGVSLGIALFPDHGPNLDTLLQNADHAMYRAKKAKLGYCLYDSEETYGNARRMELQRDMRPAMDAGQIDLVFQPQVETASDRVIGAEALIRWAHPKYGLLQPADFLPIADQTGMILPLTLVVLNRCLETQRRLREAGLDLELSVNLSPKWLNDDRFPRILRLIVSSWQGKASKLTIEVPESAIMTDPSTTTRVLSDLALAGISLSLDDFGAGYSSLPLLQRLPISELKIHRGFIADMVENEDTAVVVRSIVRLAHGLGMRVVGEGVETAAAAEKLRTLGCDRLQGFFLARPMSPEDLVRWILKREGAQVLN